MAVKFEFVLSDLDAEIFCGIIKSYINNAKFESLSAENEFLRDRDWYKRHAVYVEELYKKILEGNTRVEE